MKRKSNPDKKESKKKQNEPVEAFQRATIEEIDNEMARINAEIKNLNDYKKELLIIKQMRPQTSAYYSAEVNKNLNINLNDSNREIFKLQKIGTDPMILVLEFAFKYKVLEVGALKELSSLCKAFWETIYFVPFTLSLNKEVKRHDVKKMSKMTKLNGIEIAWYPANIKLMEQLLKLNGNLIDNLVIRYDHYNGKGAVIPATFSNSFKMLKYVDSLSSGKKKFDFSRMASIESLCLILHSAPKEYHDKLFPCLPPNMKRVCVLTSSIDQYLDIHRIMEYEHLTIIEPICVQATNSFFRNFFVRFFLPRSNTKTLTLIRLFASQKKPDPLIPIVVHHEIYAKDATGDYVIAASATYKSNIMSLAEIAHKHLSIEFEEDAAIPNFPSNKYIDEHFKVFKNFFPELVYSFDDKYKLRYTTR